MSIILHGNVLGGPQQVDAALSSTSVNPLQNKVVTQELEKKLDKTSVGAAGGVAGLDDSGKVLRIQLPVALSNGIGAVTCLGTQGLLLASNGRMSILKASESEVDERAQSYKPIVPNNLDYAVRSVLPNVTVIPSATTEYSLVDASATTNNHSMTYSHVPSAASTYALPSVSAATTVHEVVLTILFRGYYRSSTDDSGSAYAWKATDGTLLYTDTTTITEGTTVAYSDTALTESAGTISLYDSVKTAFAMVGSYSFEDAAGNDIEPLSTPTIEVGSAVTFLCRWEALLGAWVIMPIPVGKEQVPA